MSALDYDDREARLPRWAQAKLADMRRLVRDAETTARQSRLDTKPSETDTLLRLYDDIPVGLPKGEAVWFVLGQDRVGRDKTVHCRVDEWGRLVVHGSDSINVQPHSGNVVHVELRR